jgi:hypothetical protein
MLISRSRHGPEAEAPFSVREIQQDALGCPKTKYGQGAEAKSVHEELDGFDYFQSQAWLAIVQLFGGVIKLRDLRAIVSAVRIHLQVKEGIILPQLSRNARRNMGLLVRYIQSNGTSILPVLSRVVLTDEPGRLELIGRRT